MPALTDDVGNNCPTPKRGGDYHGIGLLEPCWEVLEKIKVKQLALMKLHDCLHGGLPKRGTCTALIEAKLAQQLACTSVR